MRCGGPTVPDAIPVDFWPPPAGFILNVRQYHTITIGLMLPMWPNVILKRQHYAYRNSMI